MEFASHVLLCKCSTVRWSSERSEGNHTIRGMQPFAQYVYCRVLAYCGISIIISLSLISYFENESALFSGWCESNTSLIVMLGG